MNALVELTNRDRARILHGRIDDVAVPKYIVDDDQAAGTQQFQGAVEVGLIVGLVGVDKSKIKTALPTLGEQLP